MRGCTSFTRHLCCLVTSNVFPQAGKFPRRRRILAVSFLLSASAGVFAGVAAYTWHDTNFTLLGYVWIAVWYAFAVFEMVYVKKVVDSVKMTTWSRSYYQACYPPYMPAALCDYTFAVKLWTWTRAGNLCSYVSTPN